jgi:hypothetical protein
MRLLPGAGRLASSANFGQAIAEPGQSHLFGRANLLLFSAIRLADHRGQRWGVSSERRAALVGRG